MVRLGRVEDPVQALWLRSALEEARIPFIATDETIAGGIARWGLPIDFLVQAEDFERAQEILREMYELGRAPADGVEDVQAESSSGGGGGEGAEVIPRESVLPAEAAAPTAERSPAAIWVETAVVLLASVVFDLWGAIATVVWPFKQVPPANYGELDLVVRGVQVSALVLYLIERSGEPRRVFGLTRPRWLVDALLAVFLWWAADSLYGALWQWLPSELPAWAKRDVGPYPVPAGVSGYLLLLLGSLSNGFREELVMRGYLFPRFERLLGSSWKSLILTTLLFASYHVYQGVAGVLHTLSVGLVFGLVFWKIRRVWPLAVAHAIADFVPSAWP